MDQTSTRSVSCDSTLFALNTHNNTEGDLLRSPKARLGGRATLTCVQIMNRKTGCDCVCACVDPDFVVQKDQTFGWLREHGVTGPGHDVNRHANMSLLQLG